jgi:hypothetical protein
MAMVFSGKQKVWVGIFLAIFYVLIFPGNIAPYVNGVTEFKDGKIQKASDYMDVLGFVIQPGSQIRLPGGVTIGE